MRRLQENLLPSYLGKWRCVALLGARQVGKSYLLKEVLKRHAGTLVSFDDPLERAEAARDPLRYIEVRYRSGEFLFIDEAAKVPEIFSAIKVIVDRYDPKPTGICLANSGNFLLLKRIKESLAGRVSLLPIYPLSWQECNGLTGRAGLLDLLDGKPPQNLPRPTSFAEIRRSREERMMWGGYPTPTLLTIKDDRVAWSRDYLKTYILPLVIDEFGIRDTASFERMAQIIFGSSSQSLNVSKLAQLAGMKQPTADQYLHHLEAMMVVERVPVFFRSVIKRVVKMPKLFVVDTLFMRGSNPASFGNFQDGSVAGRIYESFIWSEIRKTIVNYGVGAECFTWRTQDKAEVDLVICGNQGCVPIEVKWSESPTRRSASGLVSFLEAYPETPRGYIVYPGETLQQIAAKIFAIPDWWLLGCYTQPPQLV